MVEKRNLYQVYMEEKQRKRERPVTARHSPKYKLGLIKSKHLILEVMGVACTLEDVILYLGCSCRSLRTLLIQNLLLVRRET